MWRSRETGSDLGIVYSALALGLTSSKITSFENVGTCGCNCGVYSWVTLGPPHPQEGRPTPANWSIGNTSFSLSPPMVGCGA
jgi:hypothetical protein